MEALVPCGGSDSWTSLSKQLTLVPWMGTFLWTFTVSLLLGMGSSAPTRYQGLTNNSLPYGSKPAQHSQSSQQFISNSFHNDGEQYHNLRKYGKLGREVVANAHASNAFKFWPHGVVVILIVLLITLCGFFLFKRYKPSREEQGFFPPDEVERRQDGSDEQSA